MQFSLPLKPVFQKGRAIDTGEVDIGAQVMQTIPPGLFWRFQITIHHPIYLKFNISLAKDSLLGIYGRRNIPPTHTQVFDVIGISWPFLEGGGMISSGFVSRKVCGSQR